MKSEDAALILFGKHIQNIYEEQELLEISTTAKYSVVQQEGKRTVNRSCSNTALISSIIQNFYTHSAKAHL